DFMSEAQKAILEEDIHHDFEMLNTLAGMSEEDFYLFLENLDENQLEGFSQMIEQYMDKYGVDDEETIEKKLPKLKTKKHFDA
ncbi:MAG: plasmid pRiA4b ORF-3 family protein, partial [Clostridium sp.]